MSRCITRKAFALVELLVVIAVIAVLVSMLLPAMRKARQHAQAVKCLAQLQQMGMAVSQYANDFRFVIPQADNTEYPADGGPGTQSRTWPSFYDGTFTNEYLPNRDIFQCVSRDSNESGIYGMLKPHSSDPAYMRIAWRTSPTKKEFFGIKLNKIRNSSEYLIIGDTSGNKVPVFPNRPPDRGSYIWEADRYSSSSTDNQRGLWAAHFNRVNAVFADGHAAAVDRAGLLGSSNFNPRTPAILGRKPGQGITHWKDLDFTANAY